MNQSLHDAPPLSPLAALFTLRCLHSLVEGEDLLPLVIKAAIAPFEKELTQRQMWPLPLDNLRELGKVRARDVEAVYRTKHGFRFCQMRCGP